MNMLCIRMVVATVADALLIATDLSLLPGLGNTTGKERICTKKK